MPIPLIEQILGHGFHSVPYFATIAKVVVTVGIIYYLKRFFSGATNTSERVLHGKVAIVTGGTSGVGAAVVRELATRGAQLVLLTRHPLSDPFLVDYIDDLRTSTGNDLIMVEQVDLSDLFSVRKFATKWIDNKPVRRLDLLVLCADEMTPTGSKLQKSKDGAELMMATNYLANFHLASILSPALRAQPPDRDVRILVGMCASYMGGDLGSLSPNTTSAGKAGKKQAGSKTLPSSLDFDFTPTKIYGTTKLAMLTFCSAFQKHLATFKRPDNLPNNARVICIDPGFTRTPGMRRYLTSGTLFGLLVYLVTYPFWWIVLKSPEQGAQGFLWAAMEAQLSAMAGDAKDVVLVKECKTVPVQRTEVHDESVQKQLWETSEKVIEELEKQSAILRARDKKAPEQAAKSKSQKNTSTPKTAEQAPKQ